MEEEAVGQRTGERVFQPEEVAYAETGKQKEGERQRQRERECEWLFLKQKRVQYVRGTEGDDEMTKETPKGTWRTSWAMRALRSHSVDHGI